MFSGDFQAIDQNVSCWLVDLIFNVPVNKFSFMLGRSHHFLGITGTFGENMCLAQGQNL